MIVRVIFKEETNLYDMNIFVHKYELSEKYLSIYEGAYDIEGLNILKNGIENIIRIPRNIILRIERMEE